MLPRTAQVTVEAPVAVQFKPTVTVRAATVRVVTVRVVTVRAVTVMAVTVRAVTVRLVTTGTKMTIVNKLVDKKTLVGGISHIWSSKGCLQVAVRKTTT